ncbi:MAG: aldehyde dehydrogenase [Clostridiales bacterium]|nr:aldehyde dehydrogenase [Clostridiales bacterium]
MQNIINGKHVDASDKATINIVNPYTGRKIDTVPNSTPKDVNRAVECAKKAQKLWVKVPVSKKVELLKIFLGDVDENKDDLAKTLSKETGKPIAQAYAEIANIRIGFEAFMEKAKHLYGNVIPAGTEAGQDKTIQMTVREPLGVMAAIIPFNFPCDLFDQKVAPAILAGNTIIVKPPHQNPLTLIKLVELMHQAGVPNGVVQVVTGEGKVGEALAKHPDVHGITFTGSTRAGVSVYQNGASHLAHVGLELGGNDAFIVLSDADIDLAVEEMVWGRMYNTGQVCCASKRFIVDKTVLKQFETKAVARLKKLVVGDPMNKKTDIGVLVTKLACEKAMGQIKNVVAQGGKILLGGKANGAQLLPTVITNIPKTADVAKDDEIFAPVVSIIPCDGVDEAVEIANQSSYGLSGCVFTSDMKTAFDVCSRLQCGGTVINGASFHRSFEMPFGGYKHSGIGTEGVMTTFEEVTKIKTITLKNILR